MKNHRRKTPDDENPQTMKNKWVACGEKNRARSEGVVDNTNVPHNVSLSLLHTQLQRDGTVIMIVCYHTVIIMMISVITRHLSLSKTSGTRGGGGFFYGIVQHKRERRNRRRKQKAHQHLRDRSSSHHSLTTN